ncbi:unnamed protein product, partial [Rotaria magnacalcarata]
NYQKLDATGSVEDSPRSGRPTTVRTEENMQLVSETFAPNPQIPQRRASLDLSNVTSQTYLQMLKDHIIPQLEEHSAFQIMIWQQDDAPLHCGKIVRDSLDDTFLNWIGRRGTVQLLS